MAVSALYTGSAPSARHDGVELLGELVDERAASAEVLGRLGAGSGDDRRSRRLRPGLLGGETTTALEELERRYHVPPLAAGDVDAADRPEGFKPTA